MDAETLFAIFPNLGRMTDRLGAHMSGGEQQMLTVARTLMGNPLLVALDEPSEGVAPVIVEEMAETIIKLKKQGLSVLLSEQNIHFAELVSDRAYVLEKGQLQWEGRMATSCMTARRSGATCRCDSGFNPRECRPRGSPSSSDRAPSARTRRFLAGQLHRFAAARREALRERGNGFPKLGAKTVHNVRGVAAGATNPSQASISNPGIPLSAMVGISGARLLRAARRWRSP